MADVCVVNKIDSAPQEGVDAVLDSIRAHNPRAQIVLAASPFHVEGDAAEIAGKRVLAIEDGPTLTHGEMTYGAAVLAAKANGAAELVDPRAVRGRLDREDLRGLPERRRAPAGDGLRARADGRPARDDRALATPTLVLIGTPIDLRRLIDFDMPALRVTYRLQEVGEPTLAGRPRRARPASATTALGVSDRRRARRERAHAARRARDCGRAAREPARGVRGAAAAPRRARARDHARERAAGRQRAAPPGARRRRGAAAAALPRRRADAGRDRRADRERARAASPAGPSPCLLTHVLVAEDDPAFDEPTKPIGPFYDEEQARAARARARLERRPGRGPRLAPRRPLARRRSRSSSSTRSARCSRRARSSSPAAAAASPSTRRGEHLAGIDAVIDKDRASALLARGLGADRLVILTEVPAVYRGFGTDEQEELRELVGRRGRGARCRARRRLDAPEGRGGARVRPRDRRRGADHQHRRARDRARRERRHAHPTVGIAPAHDRRRRQLKGRRLHPRRRLERARSCSSVLDLADDLKARQQRRERAPPPPRPHARDDLPEAVDADARLVRGRDRPARRHRRSTSRAGDLQLGRGETIRDTADRALALPRRDHDPHVRAGRRRRARRSTRRSR